MEAPHLTAAEILGKPGYHAISYGGYRSVTRDTQPSLQQLKEDMKILAAMGVRIIRTYNVHLPHAPNVLLAIEALKKEDPGFEMYVMLGAWIDCKNAWTDLPPDHNAESERNAAEIDRAVALAQQHPDIVKVIAVGNEAMVKWATSYYVQPGVILKWVNHLQALKQKGELPKDLWITSSDNFASWGGGGSEYHVEDLNKLIHAVDYISMHTYPMHDTHYNPQFWGARSQGPGKDKKAMIEAAMLRAKAYAISQYDSVAHYMQSLGVDKPIHIGETGWASNDNSLYGAEGSRATDEYKQSLFYHHIRSWTDEKNIACFYFEAFDEPWKDAQNPGGSENHFGLINLRGQAKHALWPLVDAGVFAGLTRDGNPITKTFGGDTTSLLASVALPPVDTLQER
ncbi:glycosyl hydrolase family 17 [Neolewinella lacunae]|uniref:Endo-1,3-beta-glucanase btgC n=1 Tax=Neolewinella lacunae TaxID=1517758 RepID=A0A923T7A1_9BACT|nr:glycosyl hydrolase family 17 [Neolewinella lacunae]MBC6993371.1 glycosyl hydrolase family 17 [Neolewinella lacunae]MDN3635171.1 glycosyl hydrolase family 17 [Neolewinella lacunae]